MAESNPEIARFDTALADYYKSMGRNDYFQNEDGKGNFVFYCEDNGLEDEDLKGELEQLDSDDIEDCLLLDFDADFPYNSANKDDQKMKQKIKEILKLIRDKQEIPTSEEETMQLDISMFKHITDQMVDDNLAKYSNQMPSFIQVADKDKELKWFLGVSDQIGYPFLSYMVDSFTMDRAKVNDNDGKPLHINQWVLNNKFVIALTNNNKIKGNKLKQAMASYSNRLMNRLHIGAPTFTIVDDLKEVTEYLVSIGKFINNLMENKTAVVKPPFQVDLMIAVQDVIRVVESEIASPDEEQDEVDDTDIKIEDPSIDHVGAVRSKLKDYPLLHFPKKNMDANLNETTENVKELARLISGRYKDFRTELSKAAGKEKKDNSNEDQKEPLSYPDLQFNAAMYPQFRRFSIFVDRRKQKPKQDQDEKDKDKDQITFFQPPTAYSTMPTGHVPEIGFEFLRNCLIPDKNGNVTALQGLCGQLLTFMFNVEQLDEIKCYIVWNGQTMRFEYEHITQVLPYLFQKNKANDAFKENGGAGYELIEEYRKYIEDKQFRLFYQTLLDWKLE